MPSSNQQAEKAYKKLQGKALTGKNKPSFEEPYFAPMSIYPNQIWLEYGLIPATAPSSLNNGQVSGVVKRYKDLVLTQMLGATSSNSFYSEELKDCIPTGVHSSYAVEIITWTADTVNNRTVISNGVKDWEIDMEAGVLTFFGENGDNTIPAIINTNDPNTQKRILISFYKYVGAKGNSIVSLTNGTMSANAYSFSSLNTAYTSNAIYILNVNVANTGSATININGLGAKTIKKVGSTGLENLESGDLVVGTQYVLSYDTTGSGHFQMLSGVKKASSSDEIIDYLTELLDVAVSSPQDNQVLLYKNSKWTNSDIATNALTYKGLYNASNNTIQATGATTWEALPTASADNIGHYYRVSTAGTYNSISYQINDWIYSDGTWRRISANSGVGSVTAIDVSYSNTNMTDIANVKTGLDWLYTYKLSSTALNSYDNNITVAKKNAWLTLQSATTGGDGTDQGAGISIGESGYKGGAAVHLTYTGDGYSYLGMGSVDGTTNIPANTVLKMYYTSKKAEFQGEVVITDTTASTNLITGAFRCAGGAAINGELSLGTGFRVVGNGRSGFFNGTGDGSSVELGKVGGTYNMEMRVHHSTAITTHDGTVSGLIDSREGSISMKGAISAGGSITVGGFDLILGNGNQTDRGNTGASRALVKDTGGKLVINYSTDFYGGTEVQGKLNVTGDITSSGNVSSTSDISVKTNIRPYTNGLDKVMALNTVVYDRKDIESDNEIGFIAQEVQKVEPALVKQTTELLSLDYARMVTLLTSAIQEQQKQIEELKSEINDLKNK